MKITLQSWLCLFASIACYSIGEFFSKKIASERLSFAYLVPVILGYASASLFWLPAIMQRNSLIVVGMIWSVLSVVSTILIGFYFGETLTSYQTIGLVFAILGILLLST